jgi:hypothetical protein
LFPASLFFGVAQTLHFKPKFALAPEALFNHTARGLPRSRRFNPENFVLVGACWSISTRAIEALHLA